VEPAETLNEFGEKLRLSLELATVTLVEAVLRPGALAVTVADPNARPVTVNEPVVPPLGTLTVGGSTSTVPDGVDFKFTLTPVGGAEVLSVKVPLIVPLSATELEASEMVIVGTTTFTVAVPETNPEADAVMVVEPVATPVTEMIAVIPSAPTVTVEGTVAAAGLLLTSWITLPLEPAGERVSVRVPVEPAPTASGFGFRLIVGVFATVMVTVTGKLFWYPSLTINCATYMPTASGTKVGDTVMAPDNVAELPFGRLSVQL